MSGLLLYLLLTALLHSSSEDLLANSCDGGNYTSNSTYQFNLKHLLTFFTSHNSTFSNHTQGSDPDKAYGLFLCRGDVSPSDCRICIQNAVQDVLSLCPSSEQATLWYDNCELRYSNLLFFGTVDNSPIHTITRSFNSQDDNFIQLEMELLNKVTADAAYNSSLMFATGTAVNGSDMVNGLAQCTRDLSMDSCNQCLQQIRAEYTGNEAWVGGKALGKSCNFIYDVNSFYQGNPTVLLNLTAPLPPPSPFAISPPTPSTSTGEGNRNVIIISVVISIVIVFLVIFALRVFFSRTRSAQNSHGMANPGEISRTESLYFDLFILKVATANFSDINRLGQGGFGAVYKGMLPNGEDIAVKRLSVNSRQGIGELKNELLLVAKLQHRNLVRLHGVCLEEGEKLLVYECMPNGSLDKFLFDPTKRKELNWERRFKIIGGIARGLLYLHEESHLKVIHRDLKSSNILLDANMKPKISDFGLAKLFEGDETQAITYRVVGTFGYMAPEYARRGRFSTKSDVYSYGILVLEIVTGRKNSAFKYDSDHGHDLLSYAWKHWRSGTALEIIDKSLGEDYSRNEAFRCIQIGLLCAQDVPVDRPSMSLVFLMLNSPSMPLQDPLPPAYLAGLSTVESDVSSKVPSQPSYFCSTDRSSTSSIGNSQLSGHTNSPNSLETNQKGKEKVQSNLIRTFNSGKTQAPPSQLSQATPAGRTN